MKIRQGYASIKMTLMPRKFCPAKPEVGMSFEFETEATTEEILGGIRGVQKMLRLTLGQEVDSILRHYGRLEGGESLGIWDGDERLPIMRSSSLPGLSDDDIEPITTAGDGLPNEYAVEIRPGVYFARYSRTWEVGAGDSLTGEVALSADHESNENPAINLANLLDTCKQAVRQDCWEVSQRIQESQRQFSSLERKQYGKPVDIPEHQPEVSVTMLL